MKNTGNNTQEKGSDRSDHCCVFGDNKKKSHYKQDNRFDWNSLNQADFLIYCWISSIISPCWKLEIGHDPNPTNQSLFKLWCFSLILLASEKALHRIVNNSMLHPHVNRHDWHMTYYAFTSQRVQSRLIDRLVLVFLFSETFRNFITGRYLFILYSCKKSEFQLVSICVKNC